jgi:hypothetical protein
MGSHINLNIHCDVRIRFKKNTFLRSDQYSLLHATGLKV